MERAVETVVADPVTSPAKAVAAKATAKAAAPARPPPPSNLTVRDVQGDKLTQVANANWRLPEGAPPRALDERLVQQIYREELGGGAAMPATSRLSLLEISQVRSTALALSRAF